MLGGLVPLFYITLQSYAGRYDHEHYTPVRLIAMYWHFLDVIWVVMFGLLVMTG